MGSVLGGFKNMLRRWRNNLKLKKKKNKYWRIKSFSYSLIAIVCFPIGILLSNKEAKKEKVIIKKQPEISQEIKKINEQLNQQIKKDEINLKINDKIKKIEKKVSTLDDISKQYFNKKIQTINIKKEYLEKKEEIKKNNENVNNIESKQSEIKENEEVKKTNVKQQKNNKEKVENYIKKTNEVIEKNIEKIKIIDLKLKDTHDYNTLHFYEFELKYIEEQIEHLKKEYSFNYEIEFDKNKLLKNNNAINDVLKTVHNEFKFIEEKKKELYNKKQQSKEELKKESKKEKKIEKKQSKKITEIEIASQIIIYNIINQEKYFQEYCKLINKSVNKKITLFSYLNSFVNSMFSFDFSIFPFNRKLNLFIGNIIINNSLRTVRRMINPKLNINYHFFEEKYYETKNILFESYKMCCDSLEQLDMLELDLQYLDKDDEIYQKIEKLRETLLEQKQELKKQNNIIEKVYVKFKED